MNIFFLYLIFFFNKKIQIFFAKIKENLNFFLVESQTMNNNNMDQKMKNCKYTMMKFLYEAVYAICISKTSPFAICWKSSMKILGILLIMFFYALVIIILYSYFFDTCKIYYLVYRNSWLSGVRALPELFLN